MSDNCVKHLFERATGLCDHCGHSYCNDCLIQPFPRKPPVCKACAIAAAGIRSSAKVAPARSQKEIKALRKAQVQAERAAAPPKPARDGRAAKAARSSTPAPPATSGSFITGAPDVLPAGLGSTAAPPRTKRLWRPATNT